MDSNHKGDLDQNAQATVSIHPMKMEEAAEVFDLVFNKFLWEQMFWDAGKQILQHPTTWIYFAALVSILCVQVNLSMAVIAAVGYVFAVLLRLIYVCHAEKREIMAMEEFKNFPEFYFKANKWSKLWVAQYNGELIASIGVKDMGHGESVELVRLGVLPKFRRQGIARKLIMIAMDHAQQFEDLKTVTICTNTYNPRTKSFFMSLGFVESGFTHLFTIVPFGLKITLQHYERSMMREKHAE